MAKGERVCVCVATFWGGLWALTAQREMEKKKRKQTGSAAVAGPDRAKVEKHTVVTETS